MVDLTEVDYWQRKAREARRDANAIKRRCRAAEADLAEASDEIERLRIMVQTRDQENSNLRKTIAGLRSQTSKFMESVDG